MVLSKVGVTILEISVVILCVRHLAGGSMLLLCSVVQDSGARIPRKAGEDGDPMEIIWLAAVIANSCTSGFVIADA